MSDFRTPFGRGGISVLNPRFTQGRKIEGGVLYSDAAFAAAIAAANSAVDGGGPRARRVLVPLGTYRFQHPLMLTACVDLVGEGGSSDGYDATVLIFEQGAYGQHGVIVQSTQSTGDVSFGGGSWIRDLCIKPDSMPAGVIKHGLWMLRGCNLSNVYVRGWPGHGINVATGDGNTNDGNRWYQVGRHYTRGDWVKTPGANRNIMTTTVGTLQVVAAGDVKGTITVKRVGAWNTNPIEDNTVVIPEGSAIAGAANANVGFYRVASNVVESPAGTFSFTAEKRSDSPYEISGYFTAPVNVGATAYAAGAISGYNEGSPTNSGFVCVEDGLSVTLPTGSAASIADGVSGLAWCSPLASGASGGDARSMGNANNLTFLHTQSDGNRGSGLYFQGSDVNACRTVGFSAIGNSGWGIDDRSFLGNHHLCVHTDANVLGPFRNAPGGNSRTSFVSPHTESSQGTGHLIFHPGAVILGIQEAGVHAESTGLTINASTFTPHLVPVTYGGRTVTTYIGRANGGVVMVNSAEPLGQGLFIGDVDGTTGAWNVGKENYGKAFSVLEGDFPGILQVNGAKIRVGPGDGGVGVEPGLGFVAANGYPLLVATVSNCFEVGDLILNQSRTGAVSADGIRGWICRARCGSGLTFVGGTTNYKEGSTVTPTVLNGYVYRRHASSPAGVYYVGADEPGSGTMAARPWPTVLGTTVTDITSGLVWECWGSTASGLVPFDGGATKDSTGTPGAVTATVNELKGVAAIPGGGATKTLVVTHPYVTAKTVVTATLQFVDATLTQILTVVPGAGSFTITGNAFATLATQVAWEVRV